jgi:nitrite reductase/ring-hydroxylating ferredoxin subunit
MNEGQNGREKMTQGSDGYVRVAAREDLGQNAHLTLQVEGHNLVLFSHGDQVYAVDNRCPHMGFPLHRGTTKDGILTCHWHHARFDLASGGTFDQWADDVRVFPVDVREDGIWVDLTPPADPLTHQRQRLRDGVERDISLVIAKAVINLLDADVPAAEPFRIGLEFGTRYRRQGWGQGLTIHTCMMNLLPYLDPRDQPRALYHGLAAVAQDSAGMAPRFMVRPLPDKTADLATLKRWFRQFVDVRDAEGAERCIISALQAGDGAGQSIVPEANRRGVADMLFAAATDHRYIQVGHVLDFTNKAFEALEATGWQTEQAELAFTSLARGYADASRMEESNAWRSPVDLVGLLEVSFDALPAALEAGAERRESWVGRDDLVAVLLGDDPQAIVDALLQALRDGCTQKALAGIVAYAAARRIAQFHTSNEFGDWDTALHTFTFANAVHQGLRRSPSSELIRGVFDAAMSVYLDRFLNIPATPLPEPEQPSEKPDAILDELTTLLDSQQQVNEAGERVALYLFSGGDPERLLATLGRLLLREDRDFHTIQTLEAAFRQYRRLGDRPSGTHVLVAAARYLAAHSPTMRAQGQTYQIAQRLHRGERLFEGA